VIDKLVSNHVIDRKSNSSRVSSRAWWQGNKRL